MKTLGTVIMFVVAVYAIYLAIAPIVTMFTHATGVLAGLGQ